MSRVELRILYRDGNVSKLRCIVNKWKFQDAMMGEQFLTFNITSETPINWAVGDFCEFRGETFTLNYVPSVTQKAGTNERQDAYTYENVKFESYQEELTRCLMLDITPTTGDYVAALGTNYTGSSKFNLFCGETTANGITLTAVCALAAKMQANLDRIYRTNGWSVLVDTTTHVTTAFGDSVLATHTEDKILSFDNNTVAEALVEVHNTFKLDYCIRGRNIYIGYNLKNLTSDNDEETFAFGYGKGYPTRNSMNKGLFRIKRIANSNQKIITRLRALGSTKNMPYRYYNKTYSHGNDALSQTLFPTNLQLPDTFETPEAKATNNAERDSIYGVNPLTNLPNLRHVKGDTNDSYIDKNDDAANCSDGIREDSARWDGTVSDLPEIYPTIEEATYDELRGALVQDQDGHTGNYSFPNYSGTERIDKLLAIGYKDGNTIVDDANIGDGILPENGISNKGIDRSASLGMANLNFDPNTNGDFTDHSNYYAGKERKLFSVQGVSAGKYAITPTHGAVIYGFSLSSYINDVSVDVGFIITVKQKNVETGAVSTIATYISDYSTITKSDGIVEVELPQIPDVVNGNSAKVSEIRVTALSDITVYFTPTIKNISLPNGSTGGFSLDYQVGNSRLDNTITSESEYTWIPVEDSDTLTNIFHVFVQDMGFDIEACWSDDTPIMSMKSGRCVGREFEIMEDVQRVTYGGKKGYMLTLQRAEDSSLGTYYPSQTNPISSGDHFVLLGIQMPGAYVKMAEVRLLRAATQYLADNYETKFTYQPAIDNIYLQRNYDNMVANGTPEKSIFWRLYAGLKFTFRGVPTSEDAPLPLAEITIEKVSISMGEGLTPKVELTLNDDVQQGTIQKLTTSVDRIYNGSLFSGDTAGVGTTGAISASLISILQSEGGKLFLSKINNDTAEGKITFNNVVTHNDIIKAKKGLRVGNFQSRFLGSGAMIDEEGNAEFESIYSRSFISTPEFRFNRITVTEGELWCTNGYGTILKVDIIDEMTGYITLKLEENDYSSIFVGDICRGIYNDIATQFETENLDDDSALYAGESESNIEGFGFSCKKGFFTSYFWVKQMITNKRGECKFLYELRNETTPHPCEFMKFAQYGSFTNNDRRSSSYATSIGHYYEMVLDGVNNWKIRSVNVVYRKGWLGDMTVTLKGGKEVELKGYGLYAQDNVYFGNAIVQLDVETLADIQNSLKIYGVDFSEYVDVITVDDVGNCIGGLWAVSGENDEYRNYRIHSAITVRKNGQLLTLAADDEEACDGTFKIITQPHGCTCVVENSTIIITGIDNIKDGVAGSLDDINFDYDAMRSTDNCSVDILIDCEGKTSIQKNFPITIKHESQPYIGADISNEFSGVSWNTQTQQYAGLPIVFDFKMWHNDEVLDIVSANDVSVTLADGSAIPNTWTYTKTIVENASGNKVARISITALPANLGLVTDLNITCAAVYSGVRYERTLVHTINKSTDTNVYSLLPSVDEVIYNKNTNSLSSNSVDIGVICDSSDNKHYAVAYNQFGTHQLCICYKKFYTDGTSDANETEYTGDAVSVNSGVERVSFFLYKKVGNTIYRTVLHDKEDVPVIANGQDGKGVEYIFITQNTETPVPTVYDVAADRQVDNYCPYTDAQHTNQWTDEPTGVASNAKLEFYAQRKKVNGVWQPFGEVKLWNRYVVDGVTPYMIDLSNEQSFVVVDSNGNETYETSRLMLFLGQSYAFNDFAITITPVNITCNNSSAAFTLTAEQKAAAQAAGYYTLTPSAITADSATITVTATKGNIVLSAVYKINKSNIAYSLITSLDTIRKDKNGSIVSTDVTLTLQVKKIVGASTSILTTYSELTAEGLSLNYVNSSGSNALTAISVATSTLIGSGAWGKIELVKNNVIVDAERLNVVSDGSDGAKGDKGDKGNKGDTGEKGDKGDKGDKGNDGSDGLNGCIERVFQTFTPGQTYYFDENTVKSGIRYNDFLAIEDDTYSSGYRVYQCTSTHTAAYSFNADSYYWREVSVNAASAFFTFLIAKNANIKILTSAQFTIAETNGTVVAGLANTTVPLWVGSSTPSNAPFRVTREGKLYATGAEISGKIIASEGTIGGFSLANNGITHIVSQSNMQQGSNMGYVICRNDYYGRFAGIGANVLPATAGNTTAVGRFENTDTHGWWSSNIALLLKAANGTYNYAFVGEGNGVLNGAIDGYKLNSFTPSSSNNTIPIKDGNRVLIYYNPSYKTVYLPTLSDCRSYLGIGSSTYFATELIIMMGSGTSGFYIYGYRSSSYGANCPHLRSNDEYGDLTGGIEMGQGDILHLMLVYDGSFNAFIISHRN